MKIILFRLLSVMLVLDLIPIIYFASVYNTKSAWIFVALLPLILLIQIILIRCRRCGCHPGLYLLMVWTILFSPELYFADTLLLRKCPKCGVSLTKPDFIPCD